MPRERAKRLRQRAQALLAESKGCSIDEVGPIHILNIRGPDGLWRTERKTPTPAAPPGTFVIEHIIPESLCDCGQPVGLHALHDRGTGLPGVEEPAPPALPPSGGKAGPARPVPAHPAPTLGTGVPEVGTPADARMRLAFAACRCGPEPELVAVHHRDCPVSHTESSILNGSFTLDEGAITPAGLRAMQLKAALDYDAALNTQRHSAAFAPKGRVPTTRLRKRRKRVR